jgi:hypothetical protein
MICLFVALPATIAEPLAGANPVHRTSLARRAACKRQANFIRSRFALAADFDFLFGNRLQTIVNRLSGRMMCANLMAA